MGVQVLKTSKLARAPGNRLQVWTLEICRRRNPDGGIQEQTKQSMRSPGGLKATLGGESRRWVPVAKGSQREIIRD